MDEDQRNQAIESNPIEAGKLIDAWFFDKWQRFNPKLPEVNEEELSGNLGWVRFIQFQDEVFTSRDKMWAKCMEQSAQTNANISPLKVLYFLAAFELALLPYDTGR